MDNTATLENPTTTHATAPAGETCSTTACSASMTIEAPATKKTKIKKKTLAKKVAYFILYVPDMAKAIEFYKSIGLKATMESAEWTEFKAGIKFALHAHDAKDYKASKTGICFGVKNAQASYESFKALGVKVLGEPTQVCEEGRSFCFEDPFGNTLSAYGK